MNESVEYVQAYKKLSDDYLAQAQAYDNLNRLYMESVKRAEDADARILELNRELNAARQQGGAK